MEILGEILKPPASNGHIQFPNKRKGHSHSQSNLSHEMLQGYGATENPKKQSNGTKRNPKTHPKGIKGNPERQPSGTKGNLKRQPHYTAGNPRKQADGTTRNPRKESTKKDKKGIRKQVFIKGHGLLDEDLNKLDRLGIASLLQENVSLLEGKRIHAHILRCGLQKDTYLGNLLICMYKKHGLLHAARAAFDAIARPDVVSWTAMIDAYTKKKCSSEALQLFHDMKSNGAKPAKVTFICVLGACANLSDLAEGKRIHTLIMDREFDSDVVIGNSLINMYDRCDTLDDACSVFDRMQERDVVSWNALLAAYANHAYGKKALQLLDDMQQQGIQADRVSYINVLGACTSPMDLVEGEVFHARIINAGLESDVVIGNSLVNMYGNCGAPDEAWSVFDHIEQRDVISWSGMIEVLCENGDGEEAMCLFKEMQDQNIKPNKVTFLTVLRACSGPAALEDGRAIHTCIRESKLESDVAIGSALITMYGKCGSLVEACSVFEVMPQGDAILWSAMIATYSHHGHGKEALDLFLRMRQVNLKPNDVTFVCLLSACSHSGLMEEGKFFFSSMIHDYGIAPILEHYTCMTDLLGRAGCLKEAEDMIHEMPFQPDAQVWTSLLGACKLHGDIERGERAAQNLLQLDPLNSGTYVLLSSMYATFNMWDKAEQIRELMPKMLPGFSWVEMENQVHEVFMADKCYPEIEATHALNFEDDDASN